MSGPGEVGVVHRRYVPHAEAHYGGNLVDGAFGLALFGDAATHLSIVHDGHEGLFAGYSSVEFLAPVRGGDVVEVEARLTGAGARSRSVAFELRVLCRAEGPDGCSTVLGEPLLATRARGTVVVPRDYRKRG
ncbi:acyl-CoA hydrolase [Pseudonocardia sp. CNS-004]|nr:acyl-CoA hydrolase [Pseudonocardia sp. CNS-004]